jgi:frataxin
MPFASEVIFEKTAMDTLNRLVDALEEADANGDIEVDAQGGIVTIKLENGKQFIVNKHAPSQQVWLSSPLSGGLHFPYDDEKKQWQLPDGRELCALLAEELLQLANIRIEL